MAVEDFLDDDGNWTCIQCGACCTNPLIGFFKPEWTTSKGVCKYLNPDSTCRIYEKRPEFCRVDVMSPDKTDREKAIACDWVRERFGHLAPNTD